MSYDHRIAELERRVSRLEGTTEHLTPPSPPSPTAHDAPLDLVAIELAPLRHGQTRATLKVWLRGEAMTLCAPGPALVVTRADAEHRDLAHLVASGDVLARPPTAREVQDYLARR